MEITLNKDAGIDITFYLKYKNGLNKKSKIDCNNQKYLSTKDKSLKGLNDSLTSRKKTNTICRTLKKKE